MPSVLAVNFDKDSGFCSYKIGSYPFIKNYGIEIVNSNRYTKRNENEIIHKSY